MVLTISGEEDAMGTELKKGTRITASYAGGKVVSGTILRPYAPDMPGWWLCQLVDEGGAYKSGCHRDQITITDNRVA